MEKRLSEYRADAQVLSPGSPVMTDITRYERRKNLSELASCANKDTYPPPQHNTPLDSTRNLAYTDPPGDPTTFDSTLEH